MKQVWKFTLGSFNCPIEMPADAEVLTVMPQFESLCIWALVDPDAPKVVRRFATLGTGHHIPDDETLKYIGTVQVHGGSLIWHIFEVVEPTEAQPCR